MMTDTELSVIAALAIGMMPADMIPVPASWGATRDMFVGAVFVFLMIWGIGSPLFLWHHHAHVTHHV